MRKGEVGEGGGGEHGPLEPSVAMPLVSVAGMDRWGILIPIEVYHVNPSNEVSWLELRVVLGSFRIILSNKLY